jgi:hypothetical protein
MIDFTSLTSVHFSLKGEIVEQVIQISGIGY